MKRILSYVIFAMAVLSAMAEELPTATLKAQYDQRTFYVDSLENDPQGKIILQQTWDAAMQAYMDDNTKRPFDILKSQGFFRESRYKCLKDFNLDSIRVWDSAGDRYRYDVEMADLSWELGDSTKTVMGYDCQYATADYHGRQWRAWFAPDVPVQDGPWQLCGLPGLIMEASCEGGLYSFVITGLQQCDERLKLTFEDDHYFISNRKDVLKMREYSRKNRAAWIGTMTSGKVRLPASVNAKEDGDDLIETDYHE